MHMLRGLCVLILNLSPLSYVFRKAERKGGSEFARRQLKKRSDEDDSSLKEL